jgi:hypothetical protein
VLKSVLLASAGLLIGAAPPDPGFDAAEVLAKSRAAYAALQSYADSGTVLDETTGFTDRSTFRTLFIRDPRYLLIDYNAVASEYKAGNKIPLDSRIVVWMQNGELETWTSSTASHETYPADGGKQVEALKSASYGTAGMSVLIPSHLYSKSGLVTPVQAMDEPEADGYDAVNGRRAFRVLGVERWHYPNGQETGVRPITLWLDTETYLLLKVVEDTPRKFPRGNVSRRIITIHPRANPKLEPAQFRFAVPEE